MNKYDIIPTKNRQSKRRAAEDSTAAGKGENVIYTVTFNPSLDYIASVDHFRTGGINRTTKELLFPGGKGINVSIVLKNLGFDNIALGFTAGFTGNEIQRLLDEKGVRNDFVRVDKGMSRINVKLRSDEETEINGMGPAIEQKDIDTLYRQLDRLKAGDILALSGSIPSVMPETMYMDIMEHLEGRGILAAVDAAGDLLAKVLPYRPFLIKPNDHELGGIFGTEIRSKDDALKYAWKLKEQGAENVLVSMAGAGAVLVDGNGLEHRAEAPKGELKNSVGAGDSMVAGFIAGYLTGGDFGQAFRMGLCAGSASAFSDELAAREEVLALLLSSTGKRKPRGCRGFRRPGPERLISTKGDAASGR